MKDLSQLIELPIKVDVSGLTRQEREQLQEKLFEYGIGWGCGDTKLRNMLNFISVSDKMYLTHTEHEDTFYGTALLGKEIKIKKLQEILGMKPKQFTKADLKEGMVVLLRGSNDRHLVINNRFVAYDGWMGFDSYSDELLERDVKNKDFDVMEVFEVIFPFSLSIEDWRLKSIWKREEKSAAQLEIEQIQKQVDELNARLETLKGSV